jgi:hypothetical protein
MMNVRHFHGSRRIKGRESRERESAKDDITASKGVAADNEAPANGSEQMAARLALIDGSSGLSHLRVQGRGYP